MVASAAASLPSSSSTDPTGVFIGFARETSGAPPTFVAGSVAESSASERVLLCERAFVSAGPAAEISSGDKGPAPGRAIDNFLLRDRSNSRDSSQEPPISHIVVYDDTQFSPAYDDHVLNGDGDDARADADADGDDEAADMN